MAIYALIFAVCFVGGALQSLIGFGCAIVMMALLPYFLTPLPQVAGMTSVVCFFCSLALVLKNRRPVRLRVILPVFLVYMAVMPISNKLSLNLPETRLRLLLGLALLLLSVYYIFFASKALRLPDGLGTASVVGAISGVLSGMFTIGGPPVVIYTMSVSENKEEYLGMIQFYFTISNLYGSIVRISSGIVTLSLLDEILTAGAGVAAGILVSLRFQNLFDWNRIRKWVYALIGFVGLTNFLQGL